MFKVQANMDPNHRDRVAFVRLCSGRFRRGMKLFNARERRAMTISAPIFFFAQQRETIDEAFPGDIIGIPNHGTLRVGDTLTEGEILKFEGLPNFAPEILRRVSLDDAMRAKRLHRALDDMAEEGVAQIFRPVSGSWPILGAVGSLQLDVLRLAPQAGIRRPGATGACSLCDGKVGRERQSGEPCALLCSQSLQHRGGQGLGPGVPRQECLDVEPGDRGVARYPVSAGAGTALKHSEQGPDCEHPRPQTL